MQEVARFAQGLAGDGPGRRLPATQGTDATFPVAGHFAGMFFRPDLVDTDDPTLRAHTAIAGATVVPQRNVEAILAGHAARLGVPVRRGVAVTGLSQDDEHVTLQTTGGPLATRWVVGADGGRSTVRHLTGIGFPGTDPEVTGYQAIADLDGAEALTPGWSWSPAGIYCYGPIPGRILTVQFTGPPADRDAPLTAAEVQASIRRVSGADVTVTALHGTATRWADNARQAETYQRAGSCWPGTRPTCTRRSAARASTWRDRITVVTGPPAEPSGLLMRPDGVIVWTAGLGPAALEQALEHWAGAPVAQSSAR